MKNFVFSIAMVLALGVCSFAEEKTKTVEFGTDEKHSITIPESWTTSNPGGMRALQVVVPKKGDDKEDSEIAVFIMKGSGGVAGNIPRWTAAFGGEQSMKEKPKEVKSAAGKTATVVELEGAYKGMTAAGPMKEAKPDYKMLGAIFEDDGVYFKLTGPKATIEASKAAFNKLVESYK